VKHLVAFVLAATASLGTPANVVCSEAPQKVATLLTPETMAKHGFSINCRFTNHTVTEGRMLPRATGVVLVQVAFDARMGPAINGIDSVEVSVREREKMLLSVPVWTSSSPNTTRFTALQFTIHKDWLPNSTLWLLEGGEGRPTSFVVDIDAFYKEKTH